MNGNFGFARPLVTVIGCCIAAAQTVAAPPLVVETEPLTPQEQQQQFVLPDGFEIELIASEPEIGQPMNLNFDAAGRLWVTHSVEYPYPVDGPGVEPRDERFGPAGEGPPRDRISVISGIGTDDLEVTHIVDGLNIPIGIVPLSTSSVVTFSIPGISRWDAKPDAPETDQPITSPTQQLLYGGFGNVDTHGMVNGLTHWIDGWVYACHGFRNTSTITGSDGHEVELNSGNTFRFRPDGSHVEQFTHGQVNPFGMTFDPWGNVYTADCHSKPLTCLIPGAYYTSFGKPHDGLGFGPSMIDHSHGSTGICGPCYYAADHFPPDYRDCLYLCNPVTGIVHRDKLIWHGSTPQVDTQPDFITCKDGWFRPVDIQLGPDGALYIADFYNAIIGHYEVPLEHPRRDRVHGRIWRVTHRQTSGGRQSPDASQPPSMPDLTRLSLDELIERLGDPNLTVRVLAAHLIVDQYSDTATEKLRAVLRADASADRRVQALWLLHRLGDLTFADWSPLADHESPLLRTHVARLIGSLSSGKDNASAIEAGLLEDKDARVRRAAAETIARHPQEGIIEPLIRLLPPADTDDTHLRHALRIALRNCLQLPGALSSRIQSGTASADITSVCLGIPSDESAAYLLHALQLEPDFPSRLAWTTHIAQHANEADVITLTSLARQQAGDDASAQLAAMNAVDAGLSQRNGSVSLAVRPWAEELASVVLLEVLNQPLAWESVPLANSDRPAVQWGTQVRNTAAGEPVRVWSSLPGGEAGVGILRSPQFNLPKTFHFWLAGHDGFPQDEASGKNLVRLVGDGVLREVTVPRQDSPVKVTWQFEENVGKLVRLELVDGMDIRAFAWTAAGDFSIRSLNPPAYVPSEVAAELISRWKLDDLEPRIEYILNAGIPIAATNQLLAAHLSLEPDVRLEALLLWREAAPSSLIARQTRELILHRDDAAISKLLTAAMRSASSSQQQQLAAVLAGRREGAAILMELVRAGHASARLLTSAAVAQKLAAVSDEAMREQLEQLVSNLPPQNEQVTALINERRAGINLRMTSSERGEAVFKKSCAACHQIGEEGKKVGPQLDGIGVRGLDRLLEDTLDPNRNVDAAFRSTTILTNDGRVLTGLLRREEGETLILADAKGEEFRVARGDIEQRSLSPLSLMPEDIAAKLPPQELYDLLRFLLSQKLNAEP